ncbi:MAG: hypothetical protein IT373_08190 [Polyangiaceae bacterium]|nr:hypothetical protein [Polyangiaceae bacterium]
MQSPLAVSIAVSAALVFGACTEEPTPLPGASGSTSAPTSAPAAQGTGSAAAPGSGTPPADLAALLALDCDKACAGLIECGKKGGLDAHNEDQAMKACKIGCNGIKNRFDPAIHGQTAERLAQFAAGECPPPVKSAPK